MDEVEVRAGGSGVEDDEPSRRGAAIVAGLRPRRERGSGPGPKIPGYVIAPDAKIGEGRFSEVYRARDLNLARDVAIKLLRQGHQADEVQRARMENEANALARLQGTAAGDRVVQIHGRSRSADGPQYLVLEWLENGSLQDRLRDSGPIAARPAASIVRAIAEVVAAIHGLGIIHRDLKPSNVLLTRDDQPKLADFGLARFERQPEGWTADGEILGTPEYMPPEQALGRAADVGAASDVYSIGAILYACLTGRPPFQGPSDAETILSLLDPTVDPVPPERLVPSVPRDLSTICLKCLDRNKEGRYRSAADLAEDLGRFLDGRSILARRAGPIERLAKLVRRNRRISAMVGLVVLTVVVGVVASRLYAREARLQEVRANKNAVLRSQALEAVMTLVTDGRWKRLGLRAVQIQLINEVLPQFEAVLQLEGDDPASRFLQASAWNNLAIARRELGRHREASEAADNARRLFRRLIAANVLVDEASMGLATSLGYLGPILGQGGKFDEAIAVLSEAAGLIEPRVTDENPALLNRLGHIYNNWANCLRFGGGGTPAAFEGADRLYRMAIEAFGRGARTLPTCRDWQARTLSNLALFAAESLKRPDEAAGLARQAAELARGLARDLPDELDSRECLASCLTNVAEIEMPRGDPAPFRPLFVEALDLYQGLSAQVPDNAEFRWSVAMAASNLAHSLMTPPGEDLPRADELLRRADELYRRLLKDSPENQDLAGYATINRGRMDELRKRRPPGP